jgi:hypothetical protein
MIVVLTTLKAYQAGNASMERMPLKVEQLVDWESELGSP